MASSRLTLAWPLALLACTACTKPEPPGTSSMQGVATVTQSQDAGDSPAKLVRASTAPDGGVREDDLALPPAGGEELMLRMRHLVEAIAQNNADLASDALLPRDAYASLHDVTDPRKSWEKGLSSPFQKAVEHTHRHTKGAASAKFVAFELGHSVTQAPPKKRDLKRPAWRVKGSKLTFSLEGKPHVLRIGELTAWRGAWYVTRLR